MRTFAVYVAALLLCKHICSSDTLVLGELVDSSLTVKKCTVVSQCPCSDNCAECDEGFGPNCDQPTCINGKCGVIRHCSQGSSTTTVAPKNQCSGTDASNCNFPRLCALCINGCSPYCTEAKCVNNQCQITPVCSICPPTTTTISIESSTIVDQCQEDGECIHPDYCLPCPDGFGPTCASAKCVNGKCQIIAPCSQKIQCTDDDLSQCIVPLLCADCKAGYGPSCSQAICKDGQCGTISPCSIYSPSSTLIYDPSSSSPTNECQEDGQCIHPDYCLQCPDGFGPSCASAKCVDGECQYTTPCSQKTQCTDKDLSQCGVRLSCLDCKIGLSPPCTQVTCVNGQCKVTLPCSISSETTTTPEPNTCTTSSECPRTKICAVNCTDGTSPLCASAKCVNGKCISIAPCSQRTCKTRATCPYNKKNCAPCPYGYGPGCEQAACSCGICSIVPPCSKRLVAPINPVTVESYAIA